LDHRDGDGDGDGDRNGNGNGNRNRNRMVPRAMRGASARVGWRDTP